jgi:hypothetical protein
MYLQVKNTFKNNLYHILKQTCNRIERKEKHYENDELTNPSPPFLYRYIAYNLLDLENYQKTFH